jgi:hypothetical protein
LLVEVEWTWLDDDAHPYWRDSFCLYAYAHPGQLLLQAGRRRSSELLADVESLLIKRLQPLGNIQCTESRISRPGMRVRCSGEWLSKRAGFYDT